MHAPGLLAIIAVGALMGACGSPATTPKGFPAHPGPTWEDAGGSPLSADVISVHHGDEHCQHDEYDFLHVGWPLGSAADRAGAGARQFVRDPNGELSEVAAHYGGELQAEWTRVDVLSGEVVRTGFTTTGPNDEYVELLLPSDRDDVVHLMIGDHVEVWPLADPPVGCD
jgi:hypothetical protein